MSWRSVPCSLRRWREQEEIWSAQMNRLPSKLLTSFVLQVNLITFIVETRTHKYTSDYLVFICKQMHVKMTWVNLKRSRFYFATSFFSDGLEKRFGSLSTSVSERAEQLQTAVAQSVSVQEGLKGLLSWLDKLVLNPGPVEPTAQAVQDALTQNQVYNKLRKLCNYQVIISYKMSKHSNQSVSQSMLMKH